MKAMKFGCAVVVLYGFLTIESAGIYAMTIEGVALGERIEMALLCNLRIYGENEVLDLPETGLDIIPGAQGIQRLPGLVGKSVATEFILTKSES